MPDRPIIFSGPMVRALLEGRKTQTRRILRDQPGPGYRYAMHDAFLGWSAYVGHPLTQPRFGLRIPYAPGDRLYVREAFITGYDIDDELGRPVGDRKVWYRATDRGLTWYDPDTECTLDNPPWKPSIHMPRWASRLTLTVTEVRVQRLQEISAEDVQAEGACELAFVPPSKADTDEARGIFRNLWNTLHGPDAWDANPWVVAVSFTVRRGNIDHIGGANA